MRLEDFMNASPVNFFAVETIKKCLCEAGYKEWRAEEACPEVKEGDKLFVTKNGSAIFAFHMGKKTLAEGGGNFYDGWMKNPHSAMLSCNDGFRPVSYYLETLE